MRAGALVSRCTSAVAPTWSMCVCVWTMAFTVRPRSRSRRRMPFASPPGSTTTASRVTSSATMVQLHPRGGTGNVSMNIVAGEV
jgi:hypothetical protein